MLVALHEFDCVLRRVCSLKPRRAAFGRMQSRRSTSTTGKPRSKTPMSPARAETSKVERCKTCLFSQLSHLMIPVRLDPCGKMRRAASCDRIGTARSTGLMTAEQHQRKRDELAKIAQWKVRPPPCCPRLLRLRFPPALLLSLPPLSLLFCRLLPPPQGPLSCSPVGSLRRHRRHLALLSQRSRHWLSRLRLSRLALSLSADLLTADLWLCRRRRPKSTMTLSWRPTSGGGKPQARRRPRGGLPPLLTPSVRPGALQMKIAADDCQRPLDCLYLRLSSTICGIYLSACLCNSLPSISACLALYPLPSPKKRVKSDGPAVGSPVPLPAAESAADMHSLLTLLVTDPDLRLASKKAAFQAEQQQAATAAADPPGKKIKVAPLPHPAWYAPGGGPPAAP